MTKETKEKIIEMLTGENLIYGSCVLAILSLFMPWVDIVFVTSSGWQQEGWIILPFWGFYIYKIFNENRLAWDDIYIYPLIMFVIIGGYIVDLPSSTVAIGPFIMCSSIIILFIGIRKYNKKYIEEKIELQEKEDVS